MKKIKNIFIVSLLLNFIFISTIFALSYQEKISVIKDKDISMYFNGHKLSLIDNKTGEKYYPLVYNNRTYIPVRAFLNVVGVNVDWDEDNNIAIFETKYNVETGMKEKNLGNWYKEQFYNQIFEQEENKKQNIETVYYEVDKTFINIPKVNNIHLKNKEVLDGTIWTGKSKDFLREYVFISEPLIFEEKNKNYGYDLNLFFEKLQSVLKKDGYSLLNESQIDNGFEYKYIKSDMNLYVQKTNDYVLLKVIKGTMIER